MLNNQSVVVLGVGLYLYLEELMMVLEIGIKLSLYSWKGKIGTSKVNSSNELFRKGTDFRKGTKMKIKL